MALTSGFYNSLNGDRKYDAEQFGELFDGIIYDGIFRGIDGTFAVTGNTNMSVEVGTGRGFFHGIWVKNDTAMTIELEEASETLNRYDTVVLEVNKSDDVRAASIYVVRGNDSSSENPPKPSIVDAFQNKYCYKLAHIYIPAGAKQVTFTCTIEDMRGEPGGTPWVTSGFDLDITSFDETEVFDSTDGYILTNVNSIPYIITPENAYLDMHNKFLESSFNGFGSGDNDNVNARIASISHKTIYRGKNLGSIFTSSQKNNISLGVFGDLYLGDFWEIDGIRWRIVDFDYWYLNGNPRTTKHHVVIMPDQPFSGYKMNDSATTTGGYLGSKMHTTHIPAIKEEHIIPAFGSANILTHSEYLINTVTNGAPSAGAHTNVDVLLPSEIMVFGCKINSPMSTGGTSRMDVKNYTISNKQLALFKYCSEFITLGDDVGGVSGNLTRDYWLRDVANATQFCRIDNSGGATTSNATVESRIRPVFGITGD